VCVGGVPMAPTVCVASPCRRRCCAARSFLMKLWRSSSCVGPRMAVAPATWSRSWPPSPRHTTPSSPRSPTPRPCSSRSRFTTTTLRRSRTCVLALPVTVPLRRRLPRQSVA
jgi:hypothetical protein